HADPRPVRKETEPIGLSLPRIARQTPFPLSLPVGAAAWPYYAPPDMSLGSHGIAPPKTCTEAPFRTGTRTRTEDDPGLEAEGWRQVVTGVRRRTEEEGAIRIQPRAVPLLAAAVVSVAVAGLGLGLGRVRA